MNQSKSRNPRFRSSSDPFSDPHPPNPPPKMSTTAALPRSQPVHRDLTDAVRDTVSVRNPDHTLRSRSTRTPTGITTTTRHPPPINHRSHSQDSVLQAAAAVERAKANGKRPKKGSQHADVIDRLDFTGVGPMFHHDGPFDACAPSRNRHRTKAPMLAWSSRPDDPPAVQYSESPYPTLDIYKAFSNTYDPPKKKVDAIAEAWGIHEPEPYEEFFAGGGSNRLYGDSPASSIRGGNDSHASHTSSRNGNSPQQPQSQKRTTKDGREARDIYREYLDEGQPTRPRATARRSIAPPPQPIFVPDAQEIIDSPASSPLPGTPNAAPKRTKSLMHRIRKMRDAPNVPVGPGNDDSLNTPPSPTSAEAANTAPRPTHRPQNSFLGRFGNNTRGAKDVSPTSETFVYIDDANIQNKELPATPLSRGYSSPEGYFDGQLGPGATGGVSSGLGRKTSLMTKVRSVVKGNAK